MKKKLPVPLMVVGTVAIDALETPHGKRDKVFGGSASYFSCAASLWAPVAVVAVVGEDFPRSYRQILERRNIDLSHLKSLPGKTFAWKGRYSGDMNAAETLATHLNTLLEFDPKISFPRLPPFAFLANIDPVLQLKVLNQMDRKAVKYVACDTMNFWIQTKLPELKKVLRRVDGFVLNEGEAQMLTGESNLVKAAQKLSKLGPRHIIIKKGAHGSLLSYEGQLFMLPAFPVDKVTDPTGAGDTFAGGLMGYLAWTHRTDFATMKKALAIATITASFTVQDFGLGAVTKVTRQQIQKRVERFRSLCVFQV